MNEAAQEGLSQAWVGFHPQQASYSDKSCLKVVSLLSLEIAGQRPGLNHRRAAWR